jgi:hypothetical protein
VLTVVQPLYFCFCLLLLLVVLPAFAHAEFVSMVPALEALILILLLLWRNYSLDHWLGLMEYSVAI